MVEELGPQSYLAIAFDGCFEDAESNIENDFGDSMKARWLHAEAQRNAANGAIEELKEQLEDSKKDWESAHAAAHIVADQKDTEIAVLRAQMLSPADLDDVRQLLSDRVNDEEDAVQKAAEDIVKYADQPESREFQMPSGCTATTLAVWSLSGICWPEFLRQKLLPMPLEHSARAEDCGNVF